MSKATDNEAFVGLAQATMKGTGHYSGETDEWAGPMTQSAFRAFAKLDPEPAPVILPVEPNLNGLPTPAESYRLPTETTAAMNAFYGTASPDAGYLDYFSFPDPETRLYDRSGELIRNATGDARPDHRCHKLLIGRLTGALAEIYATLGEAEFERQGWHVYGGCYNYRKKRGGSSLSTHSWGLAIDINPDENPYGQSRRTFSDAAVDIMERWGFLSGGRAWGHDWMHFQAAFPNLSSGSYYSKNGFPKNVVR